MKTPLVSVVVPVHNAEPYLDRCVGSLLCQTWGDIEVILVDDGSVDGSLRRCRELSSLDDRVILLSQLNGGVSAARNRGMASASGQYLGFLDADDWVEPDMIERLVTHAEAQGADVVLAGCWVDVLDDHDQLLSSRALLPGPIGSIGSRTAPGVTPELTTLVGYAWNKLYRRDLVVRTQATFPVELPLYEDVRFAAVLMTATNRIDVLNQAFVHYVQRPGASGGTRFVPDYLSMRLDAIADLRRVYQAWGEAPESLDRATARWEVDALRSLVRRIEQHPSWNLNEKRIHLMEVRAASAQRLHSLSTHLTSRTERAYVRAFFTLPSLLLLMAERLHNWGRQLRPQYNAARKGRP